MAPHSSTPSRPIVIVGAGLAGMSCALHLRRPHMLLERTASVGGAARSYRRRGFTFDCTGHWMHLRDARVRAWVEQLLPAARWRRVVRRAAVYSHGRYVRYPFQAHTHGLPDAVVADCVLGYFAAREAAARGEHGPPASFAEYIAQRLGDGIARHFMLPYNAKLWTVHPREMAHAWCGRFVPLPSPEEVVLGALRPQGSGRALGYNAEFLYPIEGGIGALAAAMRRCLRVPPRLRARVRRVDWRRRRLWLQCGAAIDYDALVSTMPLPALVAALAAVPAAVRAAAARLRATELTYWDLGRARATEAEHWHWAYYPGPEVPFYRVGSASAAMPETAPAGHASFYVEVAHPAGSACPVSDAAMLAGLRRVGLLHPGEAPVLLRRSRISGAYVIMDHAYGEARNTCLSWLAARGIHGVGRYGAWMYDSMEGAMQQGMAAAAALDG